MLQAMQEHAGDHADVRRACAVSFSTIDARISAWYGESQRKSALRAIPELVEHLAHRLVRAAQDVHVAHALDVAVGLRQEPAFRQRAAARRARIMVPRRRSPRSVCCSAASCGERGAQLRKCPSFHNGKMMLDRRRPPPSSPAGCVGVSPGSRARIRRHAACRRRPSARASRRQYND